MRKSHRHPEAKPPFKQPDRRGPHGRKLCRWCWKEVGPRRSTWCSQVCVDQYRELFDWNYIRRNVFKRDGGVCALCKCDTEKIERIITHARRAEHLLGWSGLVESGWRHAPLRLTLFGTKRGGSGFAEVDHIRQRAEGGDNSLPNLRTLCVGCHLTETNKFVRRRAKRRRK